MDFMKLNNVVIPALLFIMGMEISGGIMRIVSIKLKDQIKYEEPKPIIVKKNVNIEANGYSPEKLSFLWESGILGRDLPKQEEKKEKEEPVQVVLSPLSDSYRLVGTIVGRTQKYAFLAPRSGGNIIVKKEGEEIEPGAVISSIKQDRIEIRRGQTKEIIFLFEKDKEKFAQGIGNNPQIGNNQPSGYFSRPINPPPYRLSTPGPQGVQPDLRQVGENTFEVRREYVISNLSDMGKLLTSARAIPYIKNGEIKGFRLINIAPGSFYKTIGLRNGDVVMSINGVPISNPQTLMKIFSDIQNESQFEIKIERMGKELTLRYYIR